MSYVFSILLFVFSFASWASESTVIINNLDILHVASAADGDDIEENPDEAVDCSEQSGRRACRLMRNFRGSLVDCRGRGCYAIWDEQMFLGRRLIRYYNRNIIDDYDRASLRMGELARSTAHILCNRYVSGPYEQIVELARIYNRVLFVLRDVQEKAQLEQIRNCRFEVRR